LTGAECLSRFSFKNKEYYKRKKMKKLSVRLSGKSQMKGKKIMKAIKHVQIILVALVAIIVLSSSAFGSYNYNGYDYMLTANAYAPTANWAEAAVSEFGPNAQVVDWNVIKSEFGGSVDSLRSFLDGIGVMDVYNAPAVTWNGSQIWSGTRSYGINRAEGNVPGGYLIHDQILNNWLLLGSWPADRQLVVSVPTPEPATLSLLALGGLSLIRRKR
jgi:hypothetical protein